MEQPIKCKKCHVPMRELWDTKQFVLTLICPNCGKERKMRYDTYRGTMGICETCRRPIENHEMCPGCGMFTGPRHTFQLIPYRWQVLCRLCIKQWKELEKDRGKRISWTEAQNIWFPKGKGRMSAWQKWQK